MNTDPNHTTDTDEITDDTEGHALRSGRAKASRFLDAAGEDDTITDDTAGHALRSGRAVRGKG